MNLKKIYHGLGFSIRKTGKDEIEIRHSFLSGYLRGFFRVLIISGLLITSYYDTKHGKEPLLGIYESIKEDFYWATNPDVILEPLYRSRVLHEDIPDFFIQYPEKYPPMSYESYREPFLKNDFWRLNRFYFKLIPLIIVLLLFFYPSPRCLRLNRKERVIYVQNFYKTFIVPVPKKGDPLLGMAYDRFSFYMFGSRDKFSLKMIMMIFDGDYTEAFFLGCYPLPNKQHNIHLVKAMREFFNQENPEFLNHIGYCYRIPWLRPDIAFCNTFAFRFPIFRRKKADKAIAEFKKHWDSLSYKEQRQRYAIAIEEQDALNRQLKERGLHNEVNDDWREEETSPALVNNRNF